MPNIQTICRVRIKANHSTTNANWEKACRTYSQNFILEEKYTQTGYIADVESEVYSAYISGHCGNYGVRRDDTGWSDYP